MNEPTIYKIYKTSDKKVFHTWVPEVGAQIHEHFELLKLMVECAGREGEIVQFIWEKEEK